MSNYDNVYEDVLDDDLVKLAKDGDWPFGCLIQIQSIREMWILQDLVRNLEQVED